MLPFPLYFVLTAVVGYRYVFVGFNDDVGYFCGLLILFFFSEHDMWNNLVF